MNDAKQEIGTTFDPEPDHRYIIGIDLGTTNSAVSYVDLQEDDERDRRSIRIFSIPQLIAAGEIADRAVLPSFLYLPGEHDLPPGSIDLPWQQESNHVVGEFAREQGVRVPGRLVSSAKSWLSHSGVDRTAPILPWGGQDEEIKVSPVRAATHYLRHIREAWNERMLDSEGEGRFEDQLIVLTVPASFDEVARELTVSAAAEAGFPRTILLEEPLAAFYAWLSTHETDWQRRMKAGQLILVCDVGGGTTDFSILGIDEGSTGLRFNRLAVGEHLMLGGDNMDLTLGRLMETRLMGQPGKLDAVRWHQLVHQARQAKEILLDNRNTENDVAISVLGSGGQLIGGTLSGSLHRSEVHQVILDGFFPLSAATSGPEETQRSGLTELGLPYVQDAAITRHLAAFWQRFTPFLATETGRQTVFPDYVLFNGGTLAPTMLRERLGSILSEWFRPLAGNDWEPEELANPRPAAAVAIGAAYYGLVRLGRGVRVGSGSPRTYYIGVESAVEADTGNADTGNADTVQTAVCLVPRGTEEGFETSLEEPAFEALANQPVAFQLLSSSTRLGDGLGEVVQLAAHEVSPLPPIRTVLRFGKKDEARRLPVQLGVRLTGIGTLDLWCQSRQSSHRWQLQFDVRQGFGDGQIEQTVEETIDESIVESARSLIVQTFDGAGGTGVPVTSLRKTLESSLEMPKERWPTPLIRALADSLLEVAKGRSATAEHEARWLNLMGFCLRPGFGDPVDEWRMKRVWKLFFQGLHHPRQAQCRTEWWIFWRRVAGGLKAGQQMELYQQVRAFVQPAQRRKKKGGSAMPKHLGTGEQLEIWTMMANFEWLTTEAKVSLGRRLLETIGNDRPGSRELWSLSRFGARETIYGPLDRLVPPDEVAKWLDRLLALPLATNESTARALIHMAAYTGDRARDLPADRRMRVARWLDDLPAASHLQELLQNPQSRLDQAEQDWVFGEALPAGLALFKQDQVE
jgi:molecular chaperone DnaK (HSP70)